MLSLYLFVTKNETALCNLMDAINFKKMMLKPESGVPALLSVPPMAVTLTHVQPAKSGVTKTTYLNVKAIQTAPSVRQLHQMLKPVTGKMLC